MSDASRTQEGESRPLFGRFPLEPRSLEPVKTPHRAIQTPLPVPESLPYFECLQRFEPRSMHCQPPVLWDHAEGASVFDAYGNQWIDLSSCVLVANSGHSHPQIVARIESLLARRQLATYVFAHAERAELVKTLVQLAPERLSRVFLLTTGSEAVENTIKLMRTWGLRDSPARKVIVSFTGGFHGRTLGSQLAGGIPALKSWIGSEDETFLQVPFPDGYLVRDTSFALFERSLEEAGVSANQVAGVITETYLGIGPDFLPEAYAKELRAWCERHGALLAFDEVQSGFGRTGRMFAFEHYGVVPDLIACGKGISGSLPLAAVIGRGDVMDTYPPGSMTSTHSGSPLPVAASLGAIAALREDKLVENAARLEPVLLAGLSRIEKAYPERIGCVRARGLVGGIRLVKCKESLEPDADATAAIVEDCFYRGVLLFAPVGLGGGCIKIAPPLSITAGALEEALAVLNESFERLLTGPGG